MIYEPRKDSFLLAEQVKKYSKDKRVLDMGAGSGIQAFTALENGAKSVLAVDIDLESVNSMKKRGLNAIESDLFSKVKGKFDLIIFNPPYLPFDAREDNESAIITSGGKLGDEIILRFLREVKNYLTKRGDILLVVSSLTPRTNIEKALKEKSFIKKIIARKKLFMEELEVWKVSYQR